MPFFAQGNSFGGGGVGRKFRRLRRRAGSSIYEFFQVFYSNTSIDLSSYGLIEDIDLFTISNGNNGGGGGASRSGGPEGGGGGGGSSGAVKFTQNSYGGVPGSSLGSIPISVNPPAPAASGPGGSISVPSPIASNFPGFTFSNGSAGSSGSQPQSWAGRGGGGGAAGIIVSHPTIPIPPVTANPGAVGGTASNGEVRPGGTGGTGGTGYGAGGGGGGGGGESHGTTAGGGAGGSGAPGIIIAKLKYRDLEEFFF